MPRRHLSAGPGFGTREAGFTLIEVLVSLAVLSIGLLGIAGLQTIGVRYNQSSYLRSHAVVLANTIMERMRVNRGEAAAGNYDILLPDPIPAVPSCIGPAKDCTAADLRDFDRMRWLSAVTNTLPGGDASISTDLTVDPPNVTVILQWEDERDGSAPLQLAFSTRL